MNQRVSTGISARYRRPQFKKSLIEITTDLYQGLTIGQVLYKQHLLWASQWPYEEGYLVNLDSPLSSEQVSNVPRFTQMVSGLSRAWTRIYLSQSFLPMIVSFQPFFLQTFFNSTFLASPSGTRIKYILGSLKLSKGSLMLCSFF